MRIDDFNLNRRESDALRSYAKNNTFPQTFLVEGGTLEERVKFARFLANMIVCKGEGEKPCGICPACVKCRAAAFRLFHINLYLKERNARHDNFKGVADKSFAG